jgi:hypothetical protein
MPEHDPLTCELCHAEGMGAEIAAVAAERDRYRETLESILINLDGENEDGNIFPAAALRIARDALNPERREQSS